MSDSSGTLTLKESDTYYNQVKIAMFCTNRKWCDLVVRTKVDLHVEHIKFNETCLSFLSKLQNFVFNSLLPELTSPHKPIRDPKWIASAKQWNSRIKALCYIRPSLVYCLFPVPIFSKTEAGRRWLLIIYYANESMQNVVYIRFNIFSNTFHYHCKA